MLPNVESANPRSERCAFFLSLLRRCEKAIIDRAVCILSPRVPKVFDGVYDIRRPQRDFAACGLDLSRCGCLGRYYVEIFCAFYEQQVTGRKLQPCMYCMPKLRDKAMDRVVCTTSRISGQSFFYLMLHSGH